MNNISRNIAEGADAFLIQEFRYILAYIVIFGGLLCVFVGPRKCTPLQLRSRFCVLFLHSNCMLVLCGMLQ